MNQQFSCVLIKYIELFGAKRSETPSLYIGVIHRELKKYKFEDKWTKANIAKFILDFIKNEIKPTLISQEAPKDEKGPVYTITTNNMGEYLKSPNNGKVLLFYYTGCKSLNLKFGKINVAFNELPQLSNIPAIAYFAKGNNPTPDYFQGTLDPSELEKFLDNKVQGEEVTSEL